MILTYHISADAVEVVRDKRESTYTAQCKLSFNTHQLDRKLEKSDSFQRKFLMSQLENPV
jgi:hypothetical protein